jgi:hypothetical protein
MEQAEEHAEQEGVRRNHNLTQSFSDKVDREGLIVQNPRTLEPTQIGDTEAKLFIVLLEITLITQRGIVNCILIGLAALPTFP